MSGFEPSGSPDDIPPVSEYGGQTDSLLDRKLLRDLRALKSQAVAVAAMPVALRGDGSRVFGDGDLRVEGLAFGQGAQRQVVARAGFGHRQRGGSGIAAQPGSQARFAAFIASETAKYASVIRKANIKLQ